MIGCPFFMAGFYSTGLIIEFSYISEIGAFKNVSNISFFILDSCILITFILLFIFYQKYKMDVSETISW